MNNTTKIIAAVFLTAVSSASFAIDVSADERVFKIGDAEGYETEMIRDIGEGAFYDLKSRRVVIQLNVRSTNKSQYNAVYLLNESILNQMYEDNVNICAPHERNPDEDSTDSVEGKPLLVMYLPYSPHREVHNNEEWGNGWRSVHTVVRVPNWMTNEDNNDEGLFLFCSRDKDGDVVGNLDDFEIKDIVMHYEYD